MVEESEFYRNGQRDKEGWWWNPDKSGYGNHIDENGHIDMMINCPYIPESFKHKIDFKTRYGMINHIIETPEQPASARIKNRIKERSATWAASDNISPFIQHDELKELENELTTAFEGVLDKLIVDPTDPNSSDTPRRLAKMYLYEVFAGRYEKRPNTTAFPNDGKNSYNGMIVVRAELKSMCAHHHQPITGTCYIGIIPNGRVLGLSKYIRIAQWCARRGTLQEELCNDIASEIRSATGSESVGVYIAAEHGCCTNRGVNAHSALTQTTVLNGDFETPDVKQEFFDNIKLQESHSKTR